MAGEVMHITDTNFEEEILKSNIPVMVDFTAAWCPPCKMVAPIVEELAREYKGRLKVAKIDVDTETQIATELGIMNIPAFIFFKNGKEYKRIVGANPKDVFEKVIKELIGG